MTGGTNYRRSFMAAAAVAFGLTMSSGEVLGKDHTNTGVVPVSGNEATYSELSAEWWQWLLGIPANMNPNLDTTGEFCDVDQSGPVWFLAGAFGGKFERACTLPAGKRLFFPVLNNIG